ncbi:hypothetical protein MRY82_10490 [bacterium]|nr:hypothetical protein [bacterium]
MNLVFQTADLLFQKRLGLTGEAIVASRSVLNEAEFNHVAFFISDAHLIHAVDPHGVEKIALSALLSSGQNVQVMRIKHLNSRSKTLALKKALTQLGKRYDFDFSGNTDKAFYCSSLIQYLFPQYFKQQPMTFKDKNTQTFHPHWLEHFDKLGKAIPEGALGTHPMGLFQSNCLAPVPQSHGIPLQNV